MEGGQKIECRQATERSQTDSEPKQYIYTQWYNESTLDEIGNPKLPVTQLLSIKMIQNKMQCQFQWEELIKELLHKILATVQLEWIKEFFCNVKVKI